MLANDLYVSDTGNSKMTVYIDLCLAVQDFGQICKIAYTDILQKYRRSVFGPLWITASTVAFIMGFAIIGSIIFGAERLTYISSLSAGIIFWQFILTHLAESTGAIYGANVEIMTERTSCISIIVRTYVRNVLTLFHNLPILLLVVIYYNTFSWAVLYFIPAFLLVSVLLVGAGLILAILGTRFRDVIPAVTMFLQFMFYFTPIFWPAETVNTYPERLMIDLNPFHHIIEILRAPFVGYVPHWISWAAVAGMAVLSIIFALIIFTKFRARIVYWI